AAALLPRLMNHHKVLFPALGLWLAWHYVERRSARAAVLLGAFAGVATLYRHDHGVYLAPGLLVAIAASHRGDGWRLLAARLGGFGAALGAILLPFAVFVHAN